MARRAQALKCVEGHGAKGTGLKRPRRAWGQGLRPKKRVEPRVLDYSHNRINIKARTISLKLNKL